MLEEFRRRKNLKRYFDILSEEQIVIKDKMGEKNPFFDFSDEGAARDAQSKLAGPERFFAPNE
jgi:hypothetical protein